MISKWISISGIVDLLFVFANELDGICKKVSYKEDCMIDIQFDYDYTIMSTQR